MMNRNIFKDQYNQIRSNLKTKWSRLTDHDLSEINGQLDVLITKLQHYYNFSREQAEREINTFCSSCVQGQKSPHRGEEKRRKAG